MGFLAPQTRPKKDTDRQNTGPGNRTTTRVQSRSLGGAAERQAPIVVMRSYRRWVEQVPDLATANIHLLNSPQNVTISRRNCPTGFDKIADLIAD